MGIYNDTEMEVYKAKLNKTVAKALEFRDKAFGFKMTLENEANFMKGCIDTLRISYPELPPAKDLNTVDGYIKLKAAIKKLNEIIESVQGNAEYQTLQEMIESNETTEKAIAGVMQMIEEMVKTPEFAEYIKNGIA